MSNKNKVNETLPPWKFITREDDKRVTAFLISHLEPLFRHYVDLTVVLPPLYHYTTGENLIKIVQNQELWATQAACLNDSTELTYAAGLLRQRIQGRSLDSSDRRVRAFRSRLSEVLLNPASEIAGTFVTCFTEQRDDLSQWRSYSGGEGGYAIEFDPKQLQLSGIDPEFETSQLFQPLVRVAYKLENDYIDVLVIFAGKCFVELQGVTRATSETEWLEEFTSYWLSQLAYLAPCFKHPKFESEKEWRFLLTMRPSDVKRMCFRQRQYMMTRHLPLILSGPRLPISSVIVGPCRHPQLSKIAVGDLLKTRDYDPDVVKVELTEVPYRAA